MKSTSLILACACSFGIFLNVPDCGAQARNKYEYEAQAIATAILSLRERGGETVGAQLCPCSLAGFCECTESCQCAAKCVIGGPYEGGTFRWVATNNPNQTALYHGNIQQGNYWHAEREYRMLLDGGTFARANCPVSPPSVRPTQTRARIHSHTILPTTTYVSTPMPTPRTYSFPQRMGTSRGMNMACEPRG